MSFEISFNPDLIYSNIQKSTDVSLNMIGEKVLQDTTQYVPMKTGLLRSTGKYIKPMDGTLIFSWGDRPLTVGDFSEADITPDIYEGINPVTGNPIHKWTTAGTGAHWDETALLNHKSEWISYFKELTREIWRRRKST